MTERDKKKPSSNDDVKQSFAWGQLFVGSILAGFSVYQLGLKALSMPPSEMLAGFVATYEAVRDFLMLPFSWVHLDLSANDKNVLAMCIVLGGAFARALIYRLRFIWLGLQREILLIASVGMVVGALAWLQSPAPDLQPQSPNELLVWLNAQRENLEIKPAIAGMAVVLLLSSIVVPLLYLAFFRGRVRSMHRYRQIRRSRRQVGDERDQQLDELTENHFSRQRGWMLLNTLILLNILFTVGWGFLLLLLNWATS
jgi:hypothetical protein